jgi:hypothetical protein
VKSQLSRSARIWIFGLLLGGAGLVLLVVWALSPDGKREAKPTEELAVSEVVAPVAETVQVEPPPVEERNTQPAAQPVKLASPSLAAVVKPAEAPKDGGLANGEPLKKMRGAIKWMAGVVGTAPENQK